MNNQEALLQLMLFNMNRYDRLNKVKLLNPRSDWLEGQLSLFNLINNESVDQKTEDRWPAGQLCWC